MCKALKRHTVRRILERHTKRLKHPRKPRLPRIKAGPGLGFTAHHCLCVSEGCEVGQWSEWGACTRRNKTCGYKWGLETRTRHIVKKPPKDTIPCPTIAESRMCKMAMRHCRRGKNVSQPYVSLWGRYSARADSKFTLLRWILKKTAHLSHRRTLSTCLV